MTKKELIEMLEGIPDTTEVIISKDAEGNCYSPLVDISYPMKYIADNTWEGQIYHLDEPESNDDAAIDAVVMWPTN